MTAPEVRTSERKKWTGGWSILVLGTITAGLTGPGQTIGVSVFTDYFVEDLRLSRSEVSVAYLIGTLTGAFLLPFVGRLVDRRGVRIAQVVVGAFFALALVNMSFVQGFVWLAIGFTGIRFLGQGSLSLISTVAVSLQYHRNRGLALGIFSTASAGLLATVPFALNFVIDQSSWRTAWVVAAAFTLVTVVPIGWFGLRNMPKSSAEQPAHVAAEAAEDGNVRSVTRAEALRTRSFWILVAVSGSAGMLSTALNFHQIDLLGDVGISKSGAAALFIPQVIGATIAGLGIGWASDRIGIRYVPAVCMALLVLAHFLAAIVQPGIIVVVYAITLGAMAGGVKTATSTLLPAWFGTAHLGSIQGLLTFFNVGASAIGPVALAVVEDGFGSYPPAVLLLAIIPAAAMLFSLTAPATAIVHEEEELTHV